MRRVLLVSLIMLMGLTSLFAFEENLTELSRIHMGPVQAVDGIGNIVYAGVGGSLNIYNVYKRDFPQLINSLPGLSSNIRELLVTSNESRIYVLSEKHGLFIYDIVDPYNPVLLGQVGTNGKVLTSMDMSDDFTLYISGTNFISEIDVTDPTDIKLTKNLQLKTTPLDIDWHNNKLYMALGTDGLAVLGTHADGKFLFYGVQPGNYTMCKGYANNILYGRLDQPKENETRLFRNIFTFPFFHPLTAEVDGKVIYSGGLNNFAIYEMVGEDNRPEIVWNLPNMPTFGSSKKDQYVYLANGWKGLSVYDVNDIRNPEEMGRIPTWGSPKEVFYHDDILYIVAGKSGVVRYHVGDREKPLVMDNLATENLIAAWDVVEHDGYLYVLGGRNAQPENVFIQIVDPARNEVIEEFPVDYVDGADDVFGLEFGPNYCAVNLGYNGIILMEYASAGALEPGASIRWEGSQFYDVEFDGDFLYASDFHGNYYIYRTPADNAPEFVGSIYTHDIGGNGIKVYDGYLLAADATNGLNIIDVSNPKMPRSVNNYPTTWGMDVEIRGERAYLTDGQGRLKVFDISNLPELELVDSLEHGGYWTKLDMFDDNLFAVDLYNGVYIMDVDPSNDELIAKNNSEFLPTETGIEGNYPNPFNSTTEIAFKVGEPSLVELSIYNIRGERIETLIAGDELPEGEYSLVWETPDQPSGVYVVNMIAGNKRFTRKIDLVK